MAQIKVNSRSIIKACELALDYWQSESTKKNTMPNDPNACFSVSDLESGGFEYSKAMQANGIKELVEYSANNLTQGKQVGSDVFEVIIPYIMIDHNEFQLLKDYL